MKVETKEEILLRLQEHSSDIIGFGVLHIGLFGSFVRNEANAESDVDLIVEVETQRKTLRNLVGLSKFLQESFGGKVEIITPRSPHPFIEKYIINEVEYVSLAA